MSVNTKVNGQLVPSAGLYKVSVPIQSGDIYSFEERQVGVWTDGKPLYQKTIDFGELPNNTTKQVNHNVSNIETVVEIKGVSYVNNLIYGENLPPVTASKAFRTSVRESVVEVSSTDNWTGYNARITFRYTKTTDVAGSGKYVPSGDKAVHYSTDEQVIGTWIDGSTLYQKTIEVSSTEVANHTKTDSDITNADVLLIEDGYYMINNGLKLALNQFESTSAYTRTGFRDDNSLYFYVNGYTSCQGAVVTIRYTKTS